MTKQGLIETLKALAESTTDPHAALVLHALIGSLLLGTEAILSQHVLAFAKDQLAALKTFKQIKEN